jgi:RNA polymerase sigma factor (sigma-70 family)
MSNSQGAVIFRHIRRLVAAQCPSQQSDMQLLQQFIADRDEAAFAMLVQRHGTMVLEVCRSVLRHQQDAEDVFQAAFLVLARKAHTIRKQEALSSWLHGVAYRLALKAKAQASRRRDREQTTTDPLSASTIDDLTMRELRVILHEEVHRLAEKYRASLLLCYWEGKTRDEAAERLGMSPGAFKKCLERARNLLASRLMRRGLVPSSAFFAMLFTENGVQAALPTVLTKTTAQASVAFVIGKTAGGSTSAVALAEGVIQAMNMTKWATMILAAIFLGALGTGFGLAAYQVLQGDDPAPANKNVAIAKLQPAAAKEKQPAPPKADKDRIVGVWRFTKGVADGKDMPAEFTALARLKFTKDGKAIMTMVEQSQGGKYKLTGPGKIDLNLQQVDKALSPGIYKFDGDDGLTLNGSNSGPPESNRPKDFTADEGSRRVLFVLVRAKPGEEKPTADEIAKLKGGLDKLREGAARAQTTNNLKQIGLALHSYHDAYNSFPAHAIYSKDGKTPLLSWRVAILPFVDQGALYKEFKLDEAWDSPHNKKLIAKMPKTYEPLIGKKDEGKTHIQVFTGPDTIFDGPKKMKIADITDGTSNTLLAVEAKEAVVWSKPADLKLPKEKDKLPALGGLFSDGFHVLFCDGSVGFRPHTTTPAVLRPFITPAARD